MDTPLSSTGNEKFVSDKDINIPPGESYGKIRNPTHFLLDTKYNLFIEMKISIKPTPNGSYAVGMDDPQGEKAIVCFFNEFTAKYFVKMVGNDRMKVVYIPIGAELDAFMKDRAKEGFYYLLAYRARQGENIPITIYKLQDFIEGKCMPIDFGQHRINPTEK